MSLENPVERSLDRTLTFRDSTTHVSSHAEGGTLTRSADQCKPSASAAFQRTQQGGPADILHRSTQLLNISSHHWATLGANAKVVDSL